jgi:hypothetical protein
VIDGAPQRRTPSATSLSERSRLGRVSREDLLCERRIRFEDQSF